MNQPQDSKPVVHESPAKEARFPIGGPREPVFHFLRANGFVMGKWSDKHWSRADGLELHLYGVGSKAVITDKSGNTIADDALDVAVSKATGAK